MKKIILLVLIINIFTSSIFAQDGVPFVVFQKNGKEISFEKMMKNLYSQDIVLFGELHNNTLCHWLELQVAKALFQQHLDLAIGMEMLEADNQLIVNEYIQKTIEARHFNKEMKLWDNYATDYAPLVDWARAKDLNVVATNIPQRYANLIYRNGPDALNALSPDALKYIAPLPLKIDLSLPGYKNMIVDMGGHGGTQSAENLAKAQAFKDATMAHFILQYREHPFFHINGAYHSMNYEGIYWYLKKADPELKIGTIHTVEQDNIHALEDEHLNSADFIIVIPKDMTKSY